jgi:hypothetical protein
MTEIYHCSNCEDLSIKINELEEKFKNEKETARNYLAKLNDLHFKNIGYQRFIQHLRDFGSESIIIN